MKHLLLTTLALCSAAAIAAPQPTSGTLGDGSGPLSFTGGPFYAPNLASDSIYLADPPDQPHNVLVCKRKAMNCDRFALTLAISEPLRQSAAGQQQVLRISLEVLEKQPVPLLKPDFHLYLLDANGEQVDSAGYGLDEAPVFHLDLPLTAVPNGRYTVVATGYNAMGASYNATVGLVAADGE